jgi:hypothetical protein
MGVAGRLEKIDAIGLIPRFTRLFSAFGCSPAPEPAVSFGATRKEWQRIEQ